MRAFRCHLGSSRADMRAIIAPMPSWNIHTAHVERLLATEDPTALGICDVNAFLFGNLLPDVYVGWMVPDASRKINYLTTHFAEKGDIPTPRYEEFFERYAVPSADASGHVSDVVLGAWTHLLADHVYNARFRVLLAREGLQPSSEVRERKQRDFDTFGRTLDIHLVPEPTSELVAQCAVFPQYPVDEPDVQKACAAMGRIVADNAEHHVNDPAYDLVDAEYFAHVPTEVDALMRAGLHAYAASKVDWGRRR